MMNIDCIECNGEGYIGRFKCHECDGLGKRQPRVGEQLELPGTEEE